MDESFGAFEWDTAKRRRNLRKQDIDFKRAIRVFDDPFVRLDEDELSLFYGEERASNRNGIWYADFRCVHPTWRENKNYLREKGYPA